MVTFKKLTSYITVTYLLCGENKLFIYLFINFSLRKVMACPQDKSDLKNLV
jgi:hypothetical protein